MPNKEPSNDLTRFSETMMVEPRTHRGERIIEEGPWIPQWLLGEAGGVKNYFR
jgi:hypothetical protein